MLTHFIKNPNSFWQALLFSLWLCGIGVHSHAQHHVPETITPPTVVATPINPTWVDANGHITHLSDHYGKVVVLNLWATWCRPCLAEMPSLDKLQRRYRTGGLVVVPVVKDERGLSTWPKMQRFWHQARITQLPLLRVAHENSLLGLTYTQIPTTFVFDRQGNLALSHTGGLDWFGQEQRAFIESLLRAPDPTAPAFVAPSGIILDLKL